MAQAIARLGAAGTGRRVLADHVVPSAARGAVATVVLMVLGAAVVAAAAQVRVPLWFTPVPLTGQTFAVLLVGAGLGFRRGAGALGLYLLVGAAGLPVFTEGKSGIAYMMGVTGGYLVGFAAAAALLGWLAERRFERRIVPALGAMLAASLVIYAFGVTGFMLSTGASLPRAIELGVLPFLGLDLAKAALAGLLLPAAWAVVRRVDEGARD